MSTHTLTPLPPTGTPTFGEIGALLARLRYDIRQSLAVSERDTFAEAIRECGYALMVAAPTIDACTTLAQRCDLLDINVADREGLTETDGLASLVFEHGKENSAACRRCEFKDGPLFHAINRVFLEFLSTTRDGQPGGRSTFSPGGVFFDSLCNPLSTWATTPPTFH
jgi:hypothetical protein